MASVDGSRAGRDKTAGGRLVAAITIETNPDRPPADHPTP